jgi:predicted RNase H-like HicB family nuclease
MKTKTWYAVVKIEWSNFGIEGETKEEAIANLKETFDAQYGIKLEDSEILEILEDK